MAVADRDPALAELLVELYEVATDCSGALAAVDKFQKKLDAAAAKSAIAVANSP
jgi:hypothetical protein